MKRKHDSRDSAASEGHHKEPDAQQQQYMQQEQQQQQQGQQEHTEKRNDRKAVRPEQEQEQPEEDLRMHPHRSTMVNHHRKRPNFANLALLYPAFRKLYTQQKREIASF